MIVAPINIVIADDHVQFRTGLATMLNMEQDFSVIGQGASAAEAIELVTRLRPDLVVLDYDMPGNGLEAATVIAQRQPATKIVILTVVQDERLIHAIKQAGAHGYLIKGIAARKLIKALRDIWLGTMIWPSFKAVGL